LTYRATATTTALATLGPLPNTSNTVDSSLKGVLLGQQTFDLTLPSSEVAISIKLNVAGWHSDGRTLWSSLTAFNLEAQVLCLGRHQVNP